MTKRWLGNNLGLLLVLVLLLIEAGCLACLCSFPIEVEQDW